MSRRINLRDVTEVVKVVVANSYRAAAIPDVMHGWADNLTVVVVKNRERSSHRVVLG